MHRLVDGAVQNTQMCDLPELIGHRTLHHCQLGAAPNQAENAGAFIRDQDRRHFPRYL